MSVDKLVLVGTLVEVGPSLAKFTITPEDGRPMAIGRDENGNVTLDVSAVVRNSDPTWDYGRDGAIRVDYVEVMESKTTFVREADRLSGVANTKVEFGASKPASADRIDVSLTGFSFRKKVDVNLATSVYLNGDDYAVHAPGSTSEFQISFQPDPPEIGSFRATPSILAVGARTTLSWSCKQADRCTVYSGEKPELVDLKLKDEKTIRITKSSITSFRLQAEKNGVSSARSLDVKALESGEWLFGAGWWDEAKLARLLVDSDGQSLYAVVVPGGDEGKPELWRSFDGFGVWKHVKAEIPSSMATSPAVCFDFSGGKRRAGDLVFVGGSRIDRRSLAASNTVYRVDPTTGKKVDEHVAEWKPRFGHACVVAPNAQRQLSIWVIGGVGEDLRPRDDVWFWDGRNQTPRWQSVGAGNPVAARYMPSAAVRGDEVWVGGGFEGVDGKPCLDVHLSPGLKDNVNLGWKKPSARDPYNPDQIPFQNIVSRPRFNAATMAVLDGNVYLLGHCGAGDTDFRMLTGRASDPMGLTTWNQTLPWPVFRGDGGRPSLIECVAFNGCLWLVAQAYIEGGRWESSSLYYWAPPPPAA